MRDFTIERALSLIVAAVYLGITGFFAYPRGKLVTDLLLVSGALLLPLACIWFSDEMGEYVGTVPGPAVNRKSPGWMVRVGGWVLLLLPAIIFFWLSYQS
jgi:hypothetical protein